MNTNFSPVPRSRSFPARFTPIVSTVVSLAVAFIVMLLNKEPQWYAHHVIVHLFIDAAGIFVSLCIFIVVWLTYDKIQPDMSLACAGFLIAALLDMLHLYYFQASGHVSASGYEAGWFYSYLARLSHVVILLLTLVCPKSLRMRKNIFLLYAIAIMALTVVAVSLLSRHLPVVEAKTFLLVRQVLWVPVIAMIIFAVAFSFRRGEPGSISLNSDFQTALLLTLACASLFAISDWLNNDLILSAEITKLISLSFLCKSVITRGIAEPYITIKAAAAHMAAVLDQLPDGIILYDEDNKASFVNSAAAEMLNTDRSKVLDLTMGEVVQRLGVSSSDIMPAHIDLEVKGTGLELNYKRLAKGHVLVFRETNPLQEPKDIRLYASTILDSITNPILVCDRKGDLVFANKKLKELFDLDDRDYIGMNISEFREKLMSDHIEVPEARSDIPIGFKEIIVKKEHNRRVFLYQEAPVIDADGETAGSVYVGSDITQLREQEKVIIQQEKLAMLGQMGVSIVHETKNFLTTIKGGIQLLEALTKDAKVRQIAKRINSATDDVNKIISSFLQLSRPQCYTYKETSLNQLLESTLPMLESSSYIKGVKLELTLCDDEQMVMCDEFQIKQVILNIANNGVEAMADAADPVLRISTAYDRMQNRMVVCIEDKGHGMPEHVIKELGKPFFTTKESGTGLGLSVCYRIIRDHKGSIDIESKVGEGTRFCVSLPCITPGS